MNEIFRFSVTRTPQRRSTRQLVRRTVEAYPGGQHSQLAASWLAMPAPGASEAAAAFIGTGNFVRSLASLWPPLSALDEWLLAHPDAQVDGVHAAIGQIFTITPADVVQMPEFGDSRARLADSLLAVTLSRRNGVQNQHLSRGLRLLAMLERMDQDEDPDVWRTALTANIILPRHAYSAPALQSPPPPSAETPTHDESTDAISRYTELSNDLRFLNTLMLNTPARIVVESVNSDPTGSTQHIRTERHLTRDNLAGFSSGTREYISGMMTAESIDAEWVRQALEPDLERYRRLAGLDRATPTLDKIGRVPTSTGIARAVGITDLLVVNQTHTRYELGEISHIENVLPHEEFSRQFRRTTSTETFIEMETETTETTERELQSTTRSELRNEARNEIQERIQAEAGAEVTYTGPGVEASVDGRFSYERSTDEAHEHASSFARDVVERAASRVEESTREYRSTRQRTEMDDFTTRSVNNDEPDAIIGVYRWVDRVAGFEILNYGRRWMIECVIPEPAAYYRYASSGPVPPGVTAVEPKPLLAHRDTGMPNDRGVPLSPAHINGHSYLIWTARYGVANVEPPPAYTKWISVAIKIEEPEASPVHAWDSSASTLDTQKLVVDDGYEATGLKLTIAHDAAAGSTEETRHYSVQIGMSHFSIWGNRPSPNVPNTVSSWKKMAGNIPVSILARGIENLAVNIVLECTRTPRAFDVWQSDTYDLIVAEYRRQQQEYLDQVAGARIQEEVEGDYGTHPLMLKQFEHTEVKRAAIMAITGQSFDAFDALHSDDPPIDMNFTEAEAEGAYIRFIEQAFDWNTMAYVFYPYFWSRKERWEQFAFKEHVDASFARFLRAGSARVLVPVHPGFEDAVDFFLKSGRPWLGGDPPVIPDEDDSDIDAEGRKLPPFIHIVEELQEQLGVDFRIGEGEVSVTSGEPTIDVSTAVLDDGFVWQGRKLRINNATYVVRSYDDEFHTVQVDRDFEGATGTYSFAYGPHVVGLPWETRLPTTLVALDGEIDEFPVVQTRL